MGYFQVRYDSRVVIYDGRGVIRLATGALVLEVAALSTLPQPEGQFLLVLRKKLWKRHYKCNTTYYKSSN